MSHKVSANSQRIPADCGYLHRVTSYSATVVGQLARDLVLSVDDLPDAGRSADAAGRREQLGGKGANQAVALAQLGVRPRLVAVAGDDVIGDVLLDQARADGIDVTAVVRRRGTLTGLVVEILQADSTWRYVQDLPLLTAADLPPDVARTDAVLVQMQQPAAATVPAARAGHDAGRLVVIDGVPPDEILRYAGVVRADDQEAELLFGVPAERDALLGPARDLLSRGPELVAVALAAGGGNLFVWADGDVVVPLTDEKVVDTTGGGDAFVASLTAALLRGADYPEAACWATAASGATVGHASGRPALTLAALDARVATLRKELADD